jgi:hypothetical protein
MYRRKVSTKRRKQINRNLKLSALAGGALNGTLSFLSGEGVNINPGAKEESFAFIPSIPSVSFNAGYQPPPLSKTGLAIVAGAALLPFLYIYLINDEVSDFISGSQLFK